MNSPVRRAAWVLGPEPVSSARTGKILLCELPSSNVGKNLMTIQEGALAAGDTSGNLGMYLGLGVKDDIVEPENEICE